MHRLTYHIIALGLLGSCSFLVLVAQEGAEQPLAANAGRNWADASNSFRVDAELVKFADGVVHLKRGDNGKVIQIPLDKLSAKDIEYVRSLFENVTGGPRSAFAVAEKLEVAAKRQRTAKAALGLYGIFMSDPAVPSAEKEKAKTLHDQWKKAAEQSLIRSGTKWLTREQIVQIETEEARIFDEAVKLYEIGSKEIAERKFRDASRMQPESNRSSFRLGLIAALIERDAAKAELNFEACVARRISRREELNAVETANLCAALNNLAITELRQRNYTSALGRWAQAMELAPATPEMLQNLGRLVYLARPDVRNKLGKRSTVSLTTTEQKRAEALLIIASRVATREFNSRSGWLYIGDVRENTPDAIISPKRPDVFGSQDPYSKMRVVGSGTGFVVAPGYVMTNAHVAENADGFYIVESERMTTRLPAVAQAVSTRSDLDLAILQCTRLQAPPVDFAPELPALGAELRLVGFPRSDQLGTSLKVTRGLVSALPPHSGMQGGLIDYKDCLLYDAVMNPGNSGGPACDDCGRVVAVNTAILLPYAVGSGYPAGVGSDRAVPFLRNNLKSVRTNWHNETADSLSWEDAVARVGKSTVQVLILRDPSRIELGDRFAAERSRKQNWDAYEDPWCMGCHGSGHCACTARDCKRGKVTEYQLQSSSLPDGTRVTKRVPVDKACSACGGKARVDCQACNGGIDPAVFFYD